MIPILWAGSEESYETYLQAQASVKALAATMQARGGDMPDLPSAWEKQGSLAIVPIQGSLIMGHAGWMSLFGVTGYADIESALTEAAMDPDIKSMLLIGKSGGGAAAGAQPLADYISQLKAVKPISGHVETTAASACYWAMCAADNLSIEPMGVTGSIGAVLVHTSVARQLGDAGVDKTVIRSGEYKMLGNPYEPLSDAAKAEMQAQVNDVSAMFEAHVAKMRGTDAADVRERMGQGRTFLGKRAVTAGLVDKVQTREQAVAAAKKR
jgi:signal peptide peptidase SppA